MADKRIFQLDDEGFLDDLTDKVYMWLDKKANEGELQEPSWKFKANVFLKILNNFATKFVPNVLTVEGKCYWHDGDLFVCDTAYTGDWVPGNFTKTSVDELLMSDTAATESDLVAGSTLPIMTANGPKSLPAEIVNYFKKGTITASGYDLNACPANSIYNCTNSTIGASVLHNPTTISQFSVITLGASSSTLVQIFSPNGSDSIYVRSKYGNDWRSWYDIKSGIIIKKFSASESYSEGALVTVNGNPFQAKTAISAGPFNASDWNDVLGKTNTLVNGSISDNGFDLNSCLVNTIYNCTNPTIGASVLHKPDGASSNFVVITLGASSATCVQFFYDSNGNYLFTRMKWGTTWTSWKYDTTLIRKFSTGSSYAKGDFVRYGSLYYKAKEAISAGAFDSSKWMDVTNKLKLFIRDTINSSGYDLNDCPSNSLVNCTNSAYANSALNTPSAFDGFIVLTIAPENGTMLQMFSDMYGTRFYTRIKWGTTWTAWRTNDIDNSSEFANVLSAFTNCVCIGDSLTWSQVYTGASSSRQAKKTYPQRLAEICDFSQETYATGGYSTKQSWEAYNGDLEYKTNALLIIYLGTNGGLTDTLDTDAPTTDPYTDWADTNTGCYAKWVAKAQSLGYRVLCVKPWDTSGDLAVTNSVIDQIGARFGVAVVGPFHTTEYKFHYYPDLSGRNNMHYNDLGYQWFADHLVNEVAKLPNEQMKYLIPV